MLPGKLVSISLLLLDVLIQQSGGRVIFRVHSAYLRTIASWYTSESIRSSVAWDALKTEQVSKMRQNHKALNKAETTTNMGEMDQFSYSCTVGCINS